MHSIHTIVFLLVQFVRQLQLATEPPFCAELHEILGRFWSVPIGHHLMVRSPNQRCHPIAIRLIVAFGAFGGLLSRSIAVLGGRREEV